MPDQILEHPFLIQEFVGLAAAGLRIGGEPPERLLGGLQVPKDVPVLQREEVRISAQDFAYPAPVDGKQVGLLVVHMDAEVPFKALQFGKGASELEADHEVSMQGESFMELGVDRQEFKQGSQRGSPGRSATNRSIKRRRSAAPSKRSASTYTPCSSS